MLKISEKLLKKLIWTALSSDCADFYLDIEEIREEVVTANDGSFLWRAKIVRIETDYFLAIEKQDNTESCQAFSSVSKVITELERMMSESKNSRISKE